MAVFTNARRLDMYRTFSGRTDAVVAADAVAKNTRVIKNCRNPGRGRMAIVALIIGRNMPGRLSGRFDPVVTGNAASR